MRERASDFWTAMVMRLRLRTKRSRLREPMVIGAHIPEEPSDLPPHLIGDARLYPYTLCENQGGALAQMGHFSAAFQQYRRAQQGFEALGADLWAADMYINMGMCCQSIRVHQEAQKYFAHASRLASASPDRGGKRLLGLIYLNQSRSYMDCSKPERAIEANEAARSIYEEINSPFDVSAALRGKALALVSLYQWESALQCCDEAIATALNGIRPHTGYPQVTRLHVEAAENMVNKATLLLQVSDLQEAKSLLERAVATLQEVVRPGRLSVQEVRAAFQNPLEPREQNLFAEAFAKSAMAQVKGTLARFYREPPRVPGSSTVTDRQREIKARQLKAFSLLHEAHNLYVELDNSRAVASTQVAMADTLRVLKHFTFAGRLLHKAEETFTTLCDIWGLAEVARSRALLYKTPKAPGDLQTAERLLRRWLRRVSTTPMAPAWYRGLAQVLHARACQFRDSGQQRKATRVADKACELYKKAIEVIEEERPKVRSDALRQGFFERHFPLYEDAINLCKDFKRFDDAFDFVEKVKARVLVEMIARNIDAIVHAAGSERPWTLFLELIQAFHHKDATEEQDKSQHLQKQEALLTQHSELLSLVTVHTLPLQDIRQKVLTDDDILLEYYQLDNKTFLAFVVDKKHGILAVESIPLVDPDTKQSIGDLAVWLQTNFMPSSLGNTVSKFETPVRFTKAYRLFLPEPIRNALHLGREYESCRKKRLIIVAHGWLHRLPFHALTDGSSFRSDDSTDWDCKFLIDEFEKGIVYAPSATALSYCRKKQKRGVAKSALILANPTGDLRFAEQAGHLLEHLYRPNARLFSRSDATAQVLSDNASQVDALILLTHGWHVDPHRGNPRLSYFQLAGNTQVTVLALYTLLAPATLHDYGCCFSATVTPHGGDEFISITRGGFYSGARSILAALWAPTDSEATVFLRKTFYEHWHACGDKGLALKLAMEETRRQWRDPVYWACWILTGDWQ